MHFPLRCSLGPAPGPFGRRWRRHRSVAAGLIAGIASASAALAQLDFIHPWDPATPLPQFITRDFVDPANLNAIARYRSGAGHSFSDNYELFDRSLKNYFEP